jgi:small subunit ribosomal protein S6
MNLYEVAILVKQEETKSNIPVYKDKIVEILNLEPGSSCQKYEYWGFRKLAYPIDRITYAHYIFLGINCSPVSLQKIEEYIKNSQKVIRHSVVKVRKISAEDSPIMHDTDVYEKKQQAPRYTRPSNASQEEFTKENASAK